MIPVVISDPPTRLCQVRIKRIWFVGGADSHATTLLGLTFRCGRCVRGYGPALLRESRERSGATLGRGPVSHVGSGVQHDADDGRGDRQSRGAADEFAPADHAVDAGLDQAVDTFEVRGMVAVSIRTGDEFDHSVPPSRGISSLAGLRRAITFTGWFHSCCRTLLGIF